MEAACCPLATPACSARSPLTLFWSKEDHSCVLLCLGAPGAAALLDLYHVWFGFTADRWARFPFSLQLGTCQSRAAHLDVLPTAMCIPPPSSKNTLLLQAGKTGPPKTTWKREATSGGPSDLFIFEQLFLLWVRQRVTKTICR